MARTSYQAPGVYVEEVPSTRQPIAGVGTNTVGFIGYVEDEVMYPVVYDGYDPVLANFALKLATPAETPEEEADRKKEKDGQIATLTKDKESKQKDLKELQAKIKRESDKDPDKSDPQLPQWKSEKDDLQNEIEGIEQTISRLEDSAKGKRDVADESKPSMLRPYYLKKFKVKAACYDTKLCTNFTEYTQLFGPFTADVPDDKDKGKFVPIHPGHRALTQAVYGFFNNGGTRCFVGRIKSRDDTEGLDRLLKEFESIDEVAIIAAPGMEDIGNELIKYAENHENVFAIVDAPADVEDESAFVDVTKLNYSAPDTVLPGRSKDAALYFPYIQVVDEAKQLQDSDPARRIPPKSRGKIYVAPSGHVAGIYARTDEERGVHKAPANCVVRGAREVKYYISKPKQELLNPQGVNCIRNMNGNIVVWGARTLGGDKNAEWKYVNVRRLFLFLQESIDEGTQWVVFEPNDPALWGKITLNVSAFLTTVWRSGALFGLRPEEAFYVKCDEETNPPEERDLGKVITEIGVAIVRPAEFVIFRMTQTTGVRSS